MKRLLALIIVWTLLVVTGTLVSADGQTHRHNSNLGGSGGDVRVRQAVFNFTRDTRVASVITDVIN